MEKFWIEKIMCEMEKKWINFLVLCVDRLLCQLIQFLIMLYNLYYNAMFTYI